ncbi:unnamed protein product [Meganyctiphanes norvegica]|uniref:Apolipoprotein D n=1 Tax=Meganyctiphanes norvegica TaxID=48144 RepID=A0AAV2PJI4_MEGNR
MIKPGLLLFGLFGLCLGHTVHLGRTCPEVEPYANLSLDKVLGAWYVMYKFDTDNSCVRWNLTRTEHPDHIKLTETRQLSVLDTFGIDHTNTISANIEIANPEVPAKGRIRWPTSLSGQADFIIFDTDYDTYMAVFECNRAGLIHRRSVTILSRTQQIDDMFVRRIRRLLSNVDVPHEALDNISHTACNGDGVRNYHVDSELFGILPSIGDKQELQRRISTGVEDYDITELEIIGDGIEHAGTFTGNLKEP